MRRSLPNDLFLSLPSIKRLIMDLQYTRLKKLIAMIRRNNQQTPSKCLLNFKAMKPPQIGKIDEVSDPINVCRVASEKENK